MRVAGPHPEEHALPAAQLRSGARVSKDVATTLEKNYSHTSAFPQRKAPELCIYLPPIEGVGNAGCSAHPQME
jgi:hypothetical protein